MCDFYCDNVVVLFSELGLYSFVDFSSHSRCANAHRNVIGAVQYPHYTAPLLVSRTYGYDAGFMKAQGTRARQREAWRGHASAATRCGGDARP